MITMNTFRFILLLVLIFVPAGLSHFLAKHKGRNVGLWTVLGLIPWLNLVFLFCLILAKNLGPEAKLYTVITNSDTQK